jgi:hypothetical protein
VPWANPSSAKDLRTVAVCSTGGGKAVGAEEGDALASGADAEGLPAEHAARTRTRAATDRGAYFIPTEYAAGTRNAIAVVTGLPWPTLLL